MANIFLMVIILIRISNRILRPLPLPARPEGLNDGLRIFRCNAEEGPGGAFRCTPSLLPVSQGGNTHADHQGELGLRSPNSFPDRLDVLRCEFEPARRLRFPTMDPSRRLDAFHQFSEKFLFHRNSSSTNRELAQSIRHWLSPSIRSFYGFGVQITCLASRSTSDLKRA